ncbi:hypothetical protein [Cellulomonas sp. NPDC089187]|uniref:hypothetical protein n=1 Tax=Cellulomonas sp. NPDC089187 TaxID=3154970 RepID=UPI00341724AD
MLIGQDAGPDVVYVDVTNVPLVRDSGNAGEGPLFVIDAYRDGRWVGDQIIHSIPGDGHVTFVGDDIVVEPVESFLARPAGCGPSSSPN